MKVSEMIKLLKELQEKHGDFEVSIYNGHEPGEFVNRLESQTEGQRSKYPTFEFDGSKPIKGGTTCS